LLCSSEGMWYRENKGRMGLSVCHIALYLHSVKYVRLS
jgi:hypothetical protein